MKSGWKCGLEDALKGANGFLEISCFVCALESGPWMLALYLKGRMTRTTQAKKSFENPSGLGPEDRAKAPPQAFLPDNSTPTFSGPKIYQKIIQENKKNVPIPG